MDYYFYAKILLYVTIFALNLGAMIYYFVRFGSGQIEFFAFDYYFIANYLNIFYVIVLIITAFTHPDSKEGNSDKKESDNSEEFDKLKEENSTLNNDKSIPMLEEGLNNTEKKEEDLEKNAEEKIVENQGNCFDKFNYFMKTHYPKILLPILYACIFNYFYVLVIDKTFKMSPCSFWQVWINILCPLIMLFEFEAVKHWRKPKMLDLIILCCLSIIIGTFSYCLLNARLYSYFRRGLGAGRIVGKVIYNLAFTVLGYFYYDYRVFRKNNKSEVAYSYKWE